MSKLYVRYDDLGVCEICDHCFHVKNDKFMCALHDDNFGEISSQDECDNFDYIPYDDDDDDDDDDDFDPNEPVECPCCGSDAYRGGSNYECDDCGWCGIP